MKFIKTFSIALMLTFILASCGMNSTENNNDTMPTDETTVTASVECPSDSVNYSPNPSPSAQLDVAQTSMDDTYWVSLCSALLSGENELGIDFYNYNIADETDVTKITEYGGCGLYDLDANGMPELFISIRNWEGGFYHVFTADDNIGKYVGESKANMIEESTGILFGVAGESGYTPDIAYEYAPSVLACLRI